MANRGHRDSDESRKRKSLAQTGRKHPHTEETKAKIRATLAAKKLLKNLLVTE